MNDRLFTYYKGCSPAPWHRLVSQLYWRVYTTNIDDVIENAYSSGSPKQRLDSVVCPADFQDGDIWFESVQSVHLHGCVLDPSKGFTFTYEDFAAQTASPSPWYQTLTEDMHVQHGCVCGNAAERATFLSLPNASKQTGKGSP